MAPKLKAAVELTLLTLWGLGAASVELSVVAAALVAR
jgi:hypothetical protein